LIYYPKGREADLYTRITDPEKQLSIISFGSKVKIPSKDLKVIEANTIWNNTVLGATLKLNVDVPELNKVANWFMGTLSPVINSRSPLYEGTLMRIQADPGSRRKIVELIGKADVQIGDINIVVKDEVVDNKFADMLSNRDWNDDLLKKFLLDKELANSEVEFLHRVIINGEEHSKSLPHKVESKGTQQYFGLSGTISTMIERESVAVIDEIETSLHPDLMKQILLIFLANSSTSQLLCTTHNVSFLDEKDIIRNDSVWFTQKRDNGSTELYSLDDFDSSTFRKGSSVINAYKIGKLGAKPNLGNIFLTETLSNG
jgi:AAA15 family ATPase/GTPase